MSLTVIILILVVGLLLVVTEVFLVPGTTIVGAIGLVVLGIGVYYAFRVHGFMIGGTALVGSGLAIILLTSVGIKRLSKSKFNVRAEIDGHVNEYDYSNISERDEGVTVTALRPEGRAMINEERVIVYSKGFYIDTNQAIVVVKIKDNKIFVEPKEAAEV
ncbi:MAG: hypothetical protein GY751_09075 [Bacteroidetes bacterium]|nr:hypothetical protein [Bacteroidota bacterium]